MQKIIQVENLSKQFTGIKAVDDLSFSVQKGEVYGFLGQNGAGKSTTIRMLLTLIRPTNGAITIFGKDIQTHRKEILQKTGAIIEKPDLYNYLTALQNISIIAKLSGIHSVKNKLMQQLEKSRHYRKGPQQGENVFAGHETTFGNCLRFNSRP